MKKINLLNSKRFGGFTKLGNFSSDDRSLFYKFFLIIDIIAIIFLFTYLFLTIVFPHNLRLLDGINAIEIILIAVDLIILYKIYSNNRFINVKVCFWLLFSMFVLNLSWATAIDEYQEEIFGLNVFTNNALILFGIVLLIISNPNILRHFRILQSNFDKSKKKYFLSIIIIILVFSCLQIFQLYHTGIGTDEGNFIYTSKLLSSNNKDLFVDFWSRESGSIIFILPWLKVFSFSLISLRYFVLFIHILIGIITYRIIDQFKLNNTYKVVVYILIILLYCSKVLNFYAAIFYQLFILFSVVSVYLLFKYIFQKNQSKLLLSLLGTVLGVSSIVYRGGVGLFLLTIIVILYKQFRNNKNFKESIINYLIISFFSSLPLTIYWIYYAIKTSYYHVYKVIIVGYFEQILTILLLTIFVHVAFSRIGVIKKQFKKFDSIIVVANIIFFGVLIYLVSSNNRFFEYIWNGIFFHSVFIIASVQLSSILLTNSNRKRTVYVVIYLLCNTIFFIKGFGYLGFYSQEIVNYLLISSLIFVAYQVLIIYLLVNMKYIDKQRINFETEVLVVISVLIFIIFALGGYLNSERFQNILFFSCILILTLISVPHAKIKKYIFALLCVNVLFFSFLNLRLSNSFIIYGMNNFNQAIDYLKNNVKPGSHVFSADTSLLSQIENNNVIPFYSPFHFKSERDGYMYDGIEIYSTDISLTKEGILEKIIKVRPEYIFGSQRFTFSIFSDKQWEKFLNDNYTEVNRIGTIRFFKLRY